MTPLDIPFARGDGYLMASAAYAAMSLPPSQIVPPMGYQWVRQLMAGSASATALSSADQRPALAMLKESPVWGIAAYSPLTHGVILSIRGTESLFEWLEDLDALAVPWQWGGSAGLVHAGFQYAYAHVREDALSLLQSCGQVSSLTLIGHSLGAAMAQMLGLDVAQHGGFSVTPTVLTYESPNPGDATFLKVLDAAADIQRIENAGDLVPLVPAPPLYPYPPHTLVHGGFKVLNPKYAHALTTVKKGLDKLVQHFIGKWLIGPVAR